MKKKLKLEKLLKTKKVFIVAQGMSFSRFYDQLFKQIYEKCWSCLMCQIYQQKINATSIFFISNIFNGINTISLHNNN